MKRINTFLSFVLILSTLLAACGPAAVDDGPEASATSPDSGTQGDPNAVRAALDSDEDHGFVAQVTSAISVDLTWPPVEGATGYRVENQFGDSEWFILAEVPGDQLAYEDFLPPSEIELTYRLTPLLGDQTGNSLQVTVSMPEKQPHPYSVVVALEEPDYSDIGLDIPGFDPETFDPSTFDPSSLDLSGIASEDIDISDLQPEPVSAISKIGPEGGQLSITGANGVVYTLDIPPQALRFETTFVITPVKSIGGYPFSGGYYGALNVWPEGVYFDVPATVTFQIPNELLQENDSNPEIIDIGFAFDRDGSEFHLVPISDRETSTAYLAESPAKDAAINPLQGGGSTTVSYNGMQRSGSVGGGGATGPELHDFSQDQTPTRKSDLTDQEAAARDALEKAKADTERRAAKLLQDLKNVRDINVLVDLLVPEFEAFYLTDDYQLLLPEEVQESLMVALLNAIASLMVPKQCPSPEASAVNEIAFRIKFPAGSFFSEVARRWNAEGDIFRDRLNLIDSVDGCKVKLTLNSGLTWSEDICKWTIGVSAEIPLNWRRRDGNDFLQGAARLKYETPSPFEVSQGFDPGNFTCLEISIGNLDPTTFTVLQLKPVFDRGSGAHTDWTMAERGADAWVVAGEATEICNEVRDDGDPDRTIYGYCGKLPSAVARDFWGGAIHLINLEAFQTIAAGDWKIDRNEDTPLKASWEPSVRLIEASGEGWKGFYSIRFTLTNR